MKRAIAILVLLVLSLSATLNFVSADIKDDLKDFKRKWSSKEILDNRDAAKDLPFDYPDYFEAHYEVLQGKHWLMRWETISKIAQAQPEIIDQFVDFVREEVGDRKEEDIAVRQHVVFGFCIGNNTTDKAWDWVYEVLVDEDQPMPVRIEAAKHLHRNYGTERNKKHFEALFKVLKQVSSPDEKEDKKLERDLEKDSELRHLRWLTIYAMEKLTSQTHGDLVNGWQIYWDGLEPDDPILYRDDGERVSNKVEGVEVEGERYARPERKLPTNLELLVLPSVEFYAEWMNPYLYELTKYFKVTVLRMPDASGMEGLRRPKDRNGVEARDAYYEPLQRIYKVFEGRRQQEGGNVGMIALGASACFMAMEYAKNQPDGIKFIVCVNAYESNAAFSSKLSWARDQGNDKILQDYAAIMRTYYQGERPNFTDEQMYRAQIGDISHLLMDPRDPNHIWLSLVRGQVNRQREDERRKKEEEAREKGERLPPRQAQIIDTEYAFEGSNIKVPALFYYSENDPLHDSKSPGKLKGMFRNVHLHEFEESGASPFAEQPMIFIERFIEFMDDEEIWEEIKPDGEGKEDK